MPEQLHGYPFWKLTFDADGKVVAPPTSAALAAEVKQAGVSDLMVFSHGWNNSPEEAMRLYVGFFGEVSKLLHSPDHPSTAKIGLVGIIWPSIRWPDEAPTAVAGGAAGVHAGATPPAKLGAELKKVFPKADSQRVLDQLTKLLDERPNDYAKLKEFKEKLRELVKSAGDGAPGIDMLEVAGATVDDDQYLAVFNALSMHEPAMHGAGGAAGLGNPFQKLWNGAKGALRVTSYWQMKNRAGVIGEHGLGPALCELAATNPTLRINLIGHSFGARLVSYALKGLRCAANGTSPVKSLYLMQGAFSHFAFADKLDFDPGRSGDLKGMASRVDGPLVTTHSLKDSAVGIAYPLASFVARQDNAAATDTGFRWEGMGHDGAQDVNAAAAFLGQPGTSYPFKTGQWLNLDGNRVIVKGGPPSGAHSDIVHPETAWAALAAAGVVK
jgi:hypothetical protein